MKRRRTERESTKNDVDDELLFQTSRLRRKERIKRIKLQRGPTLKEQRMSIVDQIKQQREAETRKGDPRKDVRTLIEQHHDLVKEGMVANPDGLTSKEKQLLEEKSFLASMSKTGKAFSSAKEIAKGIVYKQSMKSTWRPPKHVRDLDEEYHQKVREKYRIEVSGDPPLPPPIRKFKDMRFPKPIIRAMLDDKIKKPTPIQIQGLPSILAGRDTIGIAFTGSGKTLVFSLPMIMKSLEEELKWPIISGEGPIGTVLCPSRELAQQTFSKVEYFTKYLAQAGYPELRTLLCMGGINFRDQNSAFRGGVHMVVATPGRLKDCLDKKRLNYHILSYFCLDEADRLMDTGFEDEIRDILSFCTGQVQKVLFSATMPHQTKELAATSMVRPVTVNVGRAGAANLDVIQEVEYVKEDAKIVYLLECLKKTAPPVLIFCSNQGDVDNVHEYLMLKGVEAMAIHGGKDQEDRKLAIQKFKEGACDVLVATDVASKGLDFPDIKHVVNFDMPKEIEDYVHRIGRTGRCGKTGVATTFININVNEMTLLDLKGLLMEADQQVPPVLRQLGGDISTKANNIVGCAYCGGLGHRIADCPKYEATKKGAAKGIVDDSLMLAQW